MGSPPAELGEVQEKYCIEKFKVSMKKAYKNQLGIQCFDELPFIEEFLQVLKGPEGSLPIHYPRLDPEPNSEGKNYEWFMMNENGRRIWVNEKSHRQQGKRCALPEIKNNKGLPYKPVKSD